ncbi:transglycosylase [Mariprofundus erugo]|uniref:murein transglycosylase A n=1 Tax=Mariprofundus erugo TaxID=2528639 RepID=UPI0010FF45B6|nr:MltA domain-containing protein [Mariprofundus erugo]TLS74041.1 transglycosylase [Mariprofundus erugo]
MRMFQWLLMGACLLLAACSGQHKQTSDSEMRPVYKKSAWRMLPDWQQVTLAPSLDALRQSCTTLAKKPDWQEICSEASLLDHDNEAAIRRFFEARFTPWQLRNGDGSSDGLITGYYEPLLYGSRTRDERFRYPVYGVPDDLLIIDLGKLYPELKDMRLRGRVDGRKVVPYYDRADIDQGHAPQGKELLWVDDEIGLFFLQVQGSGRVQLPDGSLIKLGYADQNGHPYASIGKALIEMGELTLEQVSLQSIRQWAQDHPERLPELLHKNPSYVFFREMPDGLQSAVGAMGVPLTAGYSMAVDRRVIPLGMPVFLATTWPNSDRPLNRLMSAQDTGGAIKGVIRADFFWGFGADAGRQAGSMKQRGQMWVLYPKGGKPVVTVLRR